MLTRRIVRAPLLAAGACLVALLALVPVVSHATQAGERAELEQELAEARAELDKAAREVAELSRQLYGGESGDVMRFVHGGPQGSMLGINIGSGAARDEGVEVMGVSPGGPAEQAGLRAGDVLAAVDGKSLRRSGERTASAQLVELMRGVQPGSVVKVDYLRDGKRRTASVTTAPAEPPIVRVIRERLVGPQWEGLPGMVLDLDGMDGLVRPWRAFGSLELVPVTPTLGAYFGTDRGLLVVRAPAGKGLPLQDGDVLQTIDGRTPESPGHAFRILGSYQPGEKVKLGVLRQRKSLVLEATMPQPEAGPHGGALRKAPPAPVPPTPPASRPTPPAAPAGSA
jgi:membrane-associated protease RseP (regulator of RpoE activity)